MNVWQPELEEWFIVESEEWFIVESGWVVDEYHLYGCLIDDDVY